MAPRRKTRRSGRRGRPPASREPTEAVEVGFHGPDAASDSDENSEDKNEVLAEQPAEEERAPPPLPVGRRGRPPRAGGPATRDRPLLHADELQQHRNGRREDHPDEPVGEAWGARGPDAQHVRALTPDARCVRRAARRGNAGGVSGGASGGDRTRMHAGHGMGAAAGVCLARHGAGPDGGRGEQTVRRSRRCPRGGAHLLPLQFIGGSVAIRATLGKMRRQGRAPEFARSDGTPAESRTEQRAAATSR
eukprot:ctg_1324.g417